MISSYEKTVQCVDCERYGGANHAKLSWSAFPENGASGKRCPACYEIFNAKRQATMAARQAEDAPPQPDARVERVKAMTVQSIHNFYAAQLQETHD